MDAGLRGARVGDAQVSEKHCGFVVNTGHASAKDVLGLIEHVQSEVKAQIGVDLEPRSAWWASSRGFPMSCVHMERRSVDAAKPSPLCGPLLRTLSRAPHEWRAAGVSSAARA